MLPSSYLLLFLLLCGGLSSSFPPAVDLVSLCEVLCLTPNKCVKTNKDDDYTLTCRNGPMRVDSDFYAKDTIWTCNPRKSGHFWSTTGVGRPIKTIACIDKIPCQLANPLISSCRRTKACTELQLHESSLPPTHDDPKPIIKLHCPTDADMLVSEPGTTTALGPQRKLGRIDCEADGRWKGTPAQLEEKSVVVPARSNVRCVSRKRSPEEIAIINEEDAFYNDDQFKKEPLEIMSEAIGDTWKIYHLSATLLSLISGIACALYALLVYNRWKNRTFDYVKQEQLHRSLPIHQVRNIEKRRQRRRKKVAPIREHPRPSPPAPPPQPELEQEIVDGELRTAASLTSMLSSSIDLHCSYDSEYSLMEYFLESNNNFEPENRKPTAERKKKKATETGAKRPYQLRLEMYSDDEWEVVNPAPVEPTETEVPLDPLERLVLELGLETDDEPTSDSDSDESSDWESDDDSKKAKTDTEVSSSSESYYESFDPNYVVPPGLRALEARIEEAVYKPGSKPAVNSLLTKEDVGELTKYMEEVIKVNPGPTDEEIEKRMNEPNCGFKTFEERSKSMNKKDGSRRKKKMRSLSPRIKELLEKLPESDEELNDEPAPKEKEEQITAADLEKECNAFMNADLPLDEIVLESDCSDSDDDSFADDDDTESGEEDAKAKTEDSDKTSSDSDSDSAVEEVDALPAHCAFKSRKQMKLKQRRKKGAVDDEQYDTSYALDKYFTKIDRQITQQEDFSGDDMEESWRMKKSRKPEDEKKEDGSAETAPGASPAAGTPGAAVAGDGKPDAAAAPAKRPNRASSAKLSAKPRPPSRVSFKQSGNVFVNKESIGKRMKESMKEKLAALPESEHSGGLP